MLRSPTALFSSSTPRVALFAGALICMAILMHRLLGMPTQLALNLFAVAFALAGLAILLGIVAIFDVWRRGVSGFSWALIGIAVAGGIYVWPLSYLQAYIDLPRINDITTDLQSPPPLVALARWRVKSANPATYPAAAFARTQVASFPDIRPLALERSVEDTYEIALATLKKLKLQIVSETPPGRQRSGLIEAVDRTLVIGFYDDLVVRVTGDGGRARIDVRSSSRYGAHDFGRNAQRVRHVLSELQTRIAASVTAPPSGRRIGSARGAKNAATSRVLKRRKGRSQKSRDRRN